VAEPRHEVVEQRRAPHVDRLLRAAPGAEPTGAARSRDDADHHDVTVHEKPARRVLAIASGKGGVGKSTLTLNLALALARDGASVGVLDADLYGPDLPLMVGLARSERARELQLWRLGRPISLPPVDVHGLKLMSIGFLVAEDQALSLPAMSIELVLRQLVHETDWGELDYLLVDLPPGTADVQQQIVRLLPLDGAIVVVGPQDVSHLDAKRVLELFADTGTRVLGGVENMAGLVCPHCGETISVFGDVREERSIWALGVERLGSIPLDPAVGNGRPILLEQPDSAPARALLAVAERLAATLD
jgi:ATP-binding protein involved in chromosome partitioning